MQTSLLKITFLIFSLQEKSEAPAMGDVITAGAGSVSFFPLKNNKTPLAKVYQMVLSEFVGNLFQNMW